MAEPLIPGGYILLSRKIIESEIWQKPPLYLKVWIYLLSRAQHTSFKKLIRGQLWITIAEIQEACSYMVGYRKETPSEKQIRSILNWLRNPYEETTNVPTKDSMIVITKGTRGMLITIENFNIYQDSKNYESNYEGVYECNDEKTAKGRVRAHDKQECYKNDKDYYVPEEQEQVEIFSEVKAEPIIMTPEESEYIKVLESIDGYPLDRKKDLDYFKTLQKRYPTLDLVQAIKQWQTYKLDKPLKAKCNARSQINTSFGKYVEWNRCLKSESSKGTIKKEVQEGPLGVLPYESPLGKRNVYDW